MKIQLIKRAENFLFGLTIVAGIIMLPYCSNTNDGVKKDLTELRAYTKEHREATDKYLEDKLEDLERKYEEKRAAAEKASDKMDNEMRDSYKQSVADWESFKSDYQAKLEAKKQSAAFEAVKVSLVPVGIHTDLSNITSANICSVYEHFYNTVNKNKDLYSKEEWTLINNIWKKMGDQREQAKKVKEPSSADRKAMNAIVIKYTAIKALNRPFAESEEEKK